MKNHIKYILALFAAALIALPSFAQKQQEDYRDLLRKQPKTMHFADTLHSPNKQKQFLRAVELAPSVFVYDEIVWIGSSTVTVKGMKFNPSMDNTLKCEIVENDPGLGKRLKRLNSVTRPLRGVVDLTVSYHNVPNGLAVDYLINNISLFGIGRSSDRKNR